jgi:hypothetical protein
MKTYNSTNDLMPAEMQDVNVILKDGRGGIKAGYIGNTPTGEDWVLHFDGESQCVRTSEILGWMPRNYGYEYNHHPMMSLDKTVVQQQAIIDNLIGKIEQLEEQGELTLITLELITANFDQQLSINNDLRNKIDKLSSDHQRTVEILNKAVDVIGGHSNNISSIVQVLTKQ